MRSLLKGDLVQLDMLHCQVVNLFLGALENALQGNNLNDRKNLLHDLRPFSSVRLDVCSYGMPSTIFMTLLLTLTAPRKAKGYENLSFLGVAQLSSKRKSNELFSSLLSLSHKSTYPHLPTTTERSPNPKTSHLPIPPTQKTKQPLSQHASSFSLGHMNMSVFALRLLSILVRCVACSCQNPTDSSA